MKFVVGDKVLMWTWYYSRSQKSMIISIISVQITAELHNDNYRVMFNGDDPFEIGDNIYSTDVEIEESKILGYEI